VAPQRGHSRGAVPKTGPLVCCRRRHHAAQEAAALHQALGLPAPTERPTAQAEARLLPGPLFTLYVLAQAHLAAHRTLAGAPCLMAHSLGN